MSSSLRLLPTPSRFPLPDWASVQSSAPADADHAALDTFWTAQGREWIHFLKRALGEGYQGYESKNFWLVSREPAETCRRLVVWAESVATKVRTLLKLDHTHRLFGKCPMIVVHDLDTYYDYLSPTAPTPAPAACI